MIRHGWKPCPPFMPHLALIEQTQSFQGHPAYNLKDLRAELIDGVISGVMENIVVTVIEINQIGRWHPALNKWLVVIGNSHGSSKEMGLNAQSSCSIKDQILQPRRRTQIMLNIEISVTDHVFQNECFNFFQGPVVLPFIREVADAIERLG